MQQHLDILITDDDKLNFQGSKAYLTDPTCRVVILQNPMIEVVTRQDAYVMNKPIYAGTFVDMFKRKGWPIGFLSQSARQPQVY